MPGYRLAGADFLFTSSMPELDPFVATNVVDASIIDLVSVFPEHDDLQIITETSGWVGNVRRRLLVYALPAGMLLRVEGCGDYVVLPGQIAATAGHLSSDGRTHDTEVILGPALVLALALRSTWCLHASAVRVEGRTIALLGESGQGKSTLGIYLSKSHGWSLVADDILPVRESVAGIEVRPHFPQLKLPAALQPGPRLPERLPLHAICALMPAEQDATPELQTVSPGGATQILLRHTAGTRMLSPEHLGEHLSFCALAARRIPVYQLTYPHRQDALLTVKEVLKTIC